MTSLRFPRDQSVCCRSLKLPLMHSNGSGASGGSCCQILRTDRGSEPREPVSMRSVKRCGNSPAPLRQQTYRSFTRQVGPGILPCVSELALHPLYGGLLRLLLQRLQQAEQDNAFRGSFPGPYETQLCLFGFTPTQQRRAEDDREV